MRALFDTVRIRTDPDGLRNVPVFACEGHQYLAVTNAGINHGTERIEQFERELRIERNLRIGRELQVFAGFDGHVSGRLPAQDHRIGIPLGLCHLGRRGPVGLGNQRPAVILHDHHLGRIVIDDVDDHAGNNESVILAAITGHCTLGDLVLDIDRPPPLGQIVAGCGDGDDLRNEPIGAVEQQCHADLTTVKLDTLSAGPLVAFAHGNGRRGDPDILFRRTCQDDRVLVENQGSLWIIIEHILEQKQFAVEQVEIVSNSPDHADHGACLVIVGHAGRDILNKYRIEVAIVAADRMLYQAAVAFEAVADNSNGLAIVAAGDVERIATSPTNQLETDFLARGGDVEPVVAFLGVDDNPLDTTVGNEQSAAEDTVVGNHEIVAEFRADNSNRIEAVTALDPHRSVHCE